MYLIAFTVVKYNNRSNDLVVGFINNGIKKTNLVLLGINIVLFIVAILVLIKVLFSGSPE